MNYRSKIYANKALYDMLIRQINNEQMCHAYLLYGKNGIGKKTLSRFIAQGVLCRGEVKPCNNCSSCHKILTGNHPDLYFLESKDTKNSIHIDEIREIRQNAYVSPNESKYKVYIIPNAENMSIGAFNALLKVLEEPPETAMFILTAQSKSAVPSTILSRCIPYALFPLTDLECIEALNDILPDVDKVKKVEAVAIADGILGRAIEILTNENNDELDSIKDSIIDGIIKMDEYMILKALSLIKSDRQLFSSLIDEVLVTIRAGILVKLSAKEYADQRQKALAFSLTKDKSLKLFEIFQNAIRLNEGNASLTLLTNWLAANIIKAIS